MFTAGTNLEFGVGAWNVVEMHQTVSCASHSFATASQVSANLGISRLKLAWELHTLSGKLSAFLDSIYEGMRAAECGKIPQGKVATHEDIRQAQRTLEYLYETTKRTYGLAAQLQLTNSSLMGSSLRSIHKRSEELMDLADWLKMSTQVGVTELDALYSEARNDLAKGEVFSLV